MENLTIQNTSSTNNVSVASASAETSSAAIATQRVVQPESTSLNTSRDDDAQRFSAVQDAAERFAQSQEEQNNSAQRFTIYRDQNSYGYVTRFTDVGDGRITVLHEWELLRRPSEDSGTILNGLA